MRSILMCFMLITISVASMSGCAVLGEKKEGIRTLLELSKSEKHKQQALRRETINFEKAKKYVNSGEIKVKKRISKNTATRKFGKPILVSLKPEGERWAYKAADSDWFDGEKVYLFFDSDGMLTDGKIVNAE